MISLLDTVAGDNATKFQLGLIIKKDTIIGVKWDSPCLGLLQSGDILHSINKEIFSDEPGKNREVLSKMIQSGGKFTINVIRFKRRPTMKPIIPKGYECMEGYEYEWTMLYLMRGMTLGLDVRLIDGKLSLTQRNVREDGSKKLEEPTAGLWFFRFPGRAVRLYTITTRTRYSSSRSVRGFVDPNGNPKMNRKEECLSITRELAPYRELLF
ncbi:hypothetical protein Y032_0213g2289 [Ancylostoma ceylanicum]|uniref:PDZ domain-containing protein n=1 Tax=Ancylostoma ceylanicum TaxID=53326 RepID=A0A016SKG4_9BILA|nr:hypothetical protein Y032_0213g2289 [Ancylostoma ceylanicum]